MSEGLSQVVLIQNPSFEQSTPLQPDPCGPWNSGIVPNWKVTTSAAGAGVGIFQPANPNSCGISLPPDGVAVAYLAHAGISQDLGPALTNGIYTLKFFVANRFYWYPGQYSAS